MRVGCIRWRSVTHSMRTVVLSQPRQQNYRASHI